MYIFACVQDFSFSYSPRIRKANRKCTNIKIQLIPEKKRKSTFELPGILPLFIDVLLLPDKY